MKLAVVGCGAVGSYYGGKLARAGHPTHFLLRSDYEVVRRSGVQVTSPEGDFHFQPLCARKPEEIGTVDLVLIGLKTTANNEFPRLVPPLVGPETSVLTLQNGLGNEEELARLFPAGQILGGLCFVCLNRIRPGLISHMDHGKVVIGEFRGPATERTEKIAQLFKAAGIHCIVTPDLAKAHWQKLVWNVPFNGLGVAGAAGYEAVVTGRLIPGRPPGPVLPTDFLMSDPRWVELIRELMLEVIAAARALGHDLPESLADEQIRLTRSMGSYKASTLLDFELGRPLELVSLFLEPLRQARATGVALPRFENLCRVLEQFHPGVQE